MTPAFTDTAMIFAIEMLRKAGVREWETPEVRQAIIEAAIELAAGIHEYEQGDGMALPDDFRIIEGTQFCFADHAGDFSPASADTLERGTPTDVQLSMASVANNAARQSAKCDLGANRHPLYILKGAVELAATPTAGNTIDCYWAESSSSTAGNGNPAGVSGSDAAYAGYSSNLDASLKQLTFIGSFIATAQATATVQKCLNIGSLSPGSRYGSLVVHNKAGSAMHSDDVEIHFILEPQYEQVQD